MYDAEKLDVGGRLNLKVYRKWWVYLPFATMHAEWLQNVLLTSRIAPAARSPLLVVRVHSCRENIGEAHSSRIFLQEKASFRDTEAETRETIEDGRRRKRNDWINVFSADDPIEIIYCTLF